MYPLLPAALIRNKMKRYIIFPSGRRLWYDLAVLLQKERRATPVAWLGDPKLDDMARKFFPESDVINMKYVNHDISDCNFTCSDGLEYFSHNTLYYQTKEKAMKMMNRYDSYGAYRYIDREVYFNHCCLFCINYLKNKSPDFLLYAESPHTVFQYIMYEIAVFLDIKVYSFCSWGIGPVMHLREGIFGAPIKKRSGETNIIDAEVKTKYLECFFNKFKEGQQFDPVYMLKQKEYDKSRKVITNKIWSTFLLLRRVLRRIKRKKNDKSIDMGVLLGSRLSFLEPVLKIYLVNSVKKRLKNELYAKQLHFDLKNNEYVYFPFHYEPERTTVPDGMDFYDQFKALVYLRQLVPHHIPIVVKEHYSQITGLLSGYKGRSEKFYSLVSKLRNIKILPVDYNSKDVIRNSVLTSTITGTAALEAACLSVPALVFGNPWFVGAPGIIKYRDGVSYDDVVTHAASGSDEVKKWMMLRYDNYGIFGCVNPSNEKMYSDMYENKNAREYELLGIYELLIANIDKTGDKHT